MFRFTARCFRVPEEHIKNRSLASAVNQQLNNEIDPPRDDRRFTSHRNRKPWAILRLKFQRGGQARDMYDVLSVSV